MAEATFSNACRTLEQGLNNVITTCTRVLDNIESYDPSNKWTALRREEIKEIKAEAKTIMERSKNADKLAKQELRCLLADFYVVKNNLELLCRKVNNEKWKHVGVHIIFWLGLVYMLYLLVPGYLAFGGGAVAFHSTAKVFLDFSELEADVETICKNMGETFETCAVPNYFTPNIRPTSENSRIKFL